MIYLRTDIVLMLAISLMALGPISESTRAQTTPSEDIVQKLTPLPQTLSVRGVTVTPGEPKSPTISLRINFDFDSAKLQNDGIIQSEKLGVALRDPRLASYRFEIAGHTDAVGTVEYNQKLSEARAKAVVEYLVKNYQISPGRLSPIGYGKNRLLDQSRPTDGINRRVQITNIGTQY